MRSRGRGDHDADEERRYPRRAGSADARCGFHNGSLCHGHRSAMSEVREPMRRLLIAYDGSRNAENALRRGFRIAAQTRAEVHVLRVLPESVSSGDRLLAEEELHALAVRSAAGCPTGTQVTTAVRMGQPLLQIIRQTERLMIDLVVLGGHRERCWGDDFFGIFAEKLLRRVSLPVLIVQTPPEQDYRALLAAVDLQSAEQVLRLACTVASARSVTGVHAFHLPLSASRFWADPVDVIRRRDEAVLRAATQSVLGCGGQHRVEMHAIARPGEVLSVLVHAWEEYSPDLLVVGTHARSGIDNLLHGSIAGMILSGLPFDILAQRLPPKRRRMNFGRDRLVSAMASSAP